MDFITADERTQLQAKLDDLKSRRGAITQRIAEARELGDLKENAEYHAAREDQGLNEAEIRRIEERLKSAKTVEESAVPTDMVFVGATVRLKDLSDGEQEVYRLVGEASGGDMGDIIEVTVNSPMGEAMMKARVGETIKVDAPRGAIEFEVVEIL